MKVAVAYENGKVFQHFGHTERFKVYDIDNDEIMVATVINTNGSGHGALADILKKCGVDALICGGIGAGAKTALAEAGITLYGGVSGSADQAVTDLLAKKLRYNSDIVCEHHQQHQQDRHHGSCGDHGAGCGHQHGHGSAQ